MRQTQHAVMQQSGCGALGQMASGQSRTTSITPFRRVRALHESCSSAPTKHAGARLSSHDPAPSENVAETVARMRGSIRPREPQIQLARVGVNDLANRSFHFLTPPPSDMPQRGVVIRAQNGYRPDLPGIWRAETEIRDGLPPIFIRWMRCQGGVFVAAHER